MTKPPPEPHPDTIITDLHKIRDHLIATAGDDLRAYVEAARKRQQESGRPVVSRSTRSLAAEVT